MSKKKEFFEELVQKDLFDDGVIEETGEGDDGVIEESGEAGDESFQEFIENKYPGNKSRAFRA
jgi:hypothetical protein